MFNLPELYPRTPKVYITSKSDDISMLCGKVTALWNDTPISDATPSEKHFGPLEVSYEYCQNVVCTIYVCLQEQDLHVLEAQVVNLNKLGVPHPTNTKKTTNNKHKQPQNKNPTKNTQNKKKKPQKQKNNHPQTVPVIPIIMNTQQTLPVEGSRYIIACDENIKYIFNQVIENSLLQLDKKVMALRKELTADELQNVIDNNKFEISNYRQQIEAIGLILLLLKPFQYQHLIFDGIRSSKLNQFAVYMYEIQSQFGNESNSGDYFISYAQQRLQYRDDFVTLVLGLRNVLLEHLQLECTPDLMSLFGVVANVHGELICVKYQKYLTQRLTHLFKNNGFKIVNNKLLPNLVENDLQLHADLNIFTVLRQNLMVFDPSQNDSFEVVYSKLIAQVQLIKLFVLAFAPLIMHVFELESVAPETQDIFQISQSEELKEDIKFIYPFGISLMHIFSTANQNVLSNIPQELLEMLQTMQQKSICATYDSTKIDTNTLARIINIIRDLIKPEEWVNITGLCSGVYSTYEQLHHHIMHDNRELVPDVVQKQNIDGKSSKVVGSLQEYQLQMKAVCYASNLMVSRILDFGNMFAVSKNQTNAFKYFQAQMYIKRIQLNPEQLEQLKEIISTNYQELIFGDEEMLNEQQQAPLIRELVEFREVDSQLAARMYVRLLYLQKRFPQDNLTQLIQSVEKQITEEVQIAVSTPLKRITKLELVQTEPNSFRVNLETEKIIEHEDVKTGFRLAVDGQEATVAEPSFKYSCKRIEVLKLIYTAKLGKVTAVVEQDLDHRYYQHMSAAWKIVRGPLLTKLSTSTQSPLELSKPEHVFVGQDNEVRFSRAASLTINASEPQGVYYKNAQNEYVEVKEAFQLETDAITLFASQPCTVFFTDAADQKQHSVQIVAPFTIMQYVTDLLNNQFMVKTILRPTREITICLEQLQTEFDVQLLNEPTILLNLEVQIVQIISQQQDNKQKSQETQLTSQMYPQFGTNPNLLIRYGSTGIYQLGINTQIPQNSVELTIQSNPSLQNQPTTAYIKIYAQKLTIGEINIFQAKQVQIIQNARMTFVIQNNQEIIIPIRYISEEMGLIKVFKVQICCGREVFERELEVLVQ
ncbi:Hypothetical_protein [Hexamita inflata]|uniref:Hypothetical_protein n=1 Tax=Hexamita inflata TaxID=28002 RepID=A0AA86UAY4_9EUKA|nr:Hypothetical protein HINF_LOCUS33091 [Hexamita inflata]